ncbi:MAG: hypothetical protein AB1485_04175 [Candidatus Thermoplasmatota archaeon]
MALRITITNKELEDKLYNMYLDAKREKRDTTWNDIILRLAGDRLGLKEYKSEERADV